MQENLAALQQELDSAITEGIRLTQYSHGAGCGCKISPKVLENERTLFDWCAKQSYIALANMMTGAALIGIDSCPIEGFNYANVERILAEEGIFDSNEYGISCMVTFGYRAKEIKKKYRKPAEEVISWIE